MALKTMVTIIAIVSHLKDDFMQIDGWVLIILLNFQVFLLNYENYESLQIVCKIFRTYELCMLITSAEIDFI